MRPQLLIGDVFAHAARAAPARTAVAVGGDRLDFATLESTSNRLARHLGALGIGKGDRVTTWTSTTIEVVPLVAALSKLGAVLVPVSGVLGVDEASALVRLARPAAAVVDLDHVTAAKQLSVPVLELSHLVADSERCDDAGVPTPPNLAGSDPHIVFFTSGSTGTPKGAVLSHETNFLRSHPGALPERRGAMVCPYPLFHMGAWTIAMQQWQARDTVVLVPPEASAICEAVGRWQATRLNCIPAVWRRILDEVEDGRGAALQPLRFADTGTSATPPDLLEAIAALVPNARLRVFYGSTEAGTVACLDHDDMARKPGSCGVPAHGVEVRLGEDGEIMVRSATLFDGYLDDDEATRRAFDGGWYRTGDLGELDDEGFLTIIGRTGELIRTGGESVVPGEVEAVLKELAAVADVAVVGVPDPTWGEVVCAVVVAGERAPTAEEIRQHCTGQLASYKHPRRVEVVAAIPRTSATGQVQRRLLVEQLLAHS
jgi:acyl-CoA synthetase (AMP-forming)/AMP-acid ligase II